MTSPGTWPVTGPLPAVTDAADPGFGIYIHWPFCQSKCPYCDFNSHVRERIDQERWRAALLRELDHCAEVTAGRTVTSVFFGGGTPSLMAPATAAALIDRIAGRWATAPGLEISLEANPTSTEAGRFQAFRIAGVNRVSLGIQALNDADLKRLGRPHDTAEALGAIALARRHFERFSFDLIYARPGQSVAAWTAELRQALEHAVGHISVYQLTIEEGTAFHPQHQRGELVLPDEDTAGALYEATQEVLAEAGLPAYEISNHARPGQECRHNLLYWLYGDYAGIGPGAHGRLTLNGGKWATRNHRAPEIWLERVERAGHGSHTPEAVSACQRLEEVLMMGLRLTTGLPRARIIAETGQDLDTVLDPAAVRRLGEGGFIEVTGSHLRATDAGRLRLNAVLAALLP